MLWSILIKTKSLQPLEIILWKIPKWTTNNNFQHLICNKINNMIGLINQELKLKRLLVVVIKVSHKHQLVVFSTLYNSFLQRIFHSLKLRKSIPLWNRRKKLGVLKSLVISTESPITSLMERTNSNMMTKPRILQLRNQLKSYNHQN